MIIFSLYHYLYNFNDNDEDINVPKKNKEGKAATPTRRKGESTTNHKTDWSGKATLSRNYFLSFLALFGNSKVKNLLLNVLVLFFFFLCVFFCF